MKTFILEHWKILGAGALALVIALILLWQDHRIETLKEERDTAQKTLSSYQTAFSELQADTAAKVGALESEAGRQVERARNSERLLGQIEGANDEKNGIVAPVLRDAIDSLYGTNAAGEAGQAGNSAKPSVVQ